MTRNKDQHWFNKKYSKVEVIDITGSRKLNFNGFLKIEGYTNLKSINFKKLGLTGLEIINCSNLKEVKLSEFVRLRSLFVTGCPNLKLDCSTGLKELNELEVSDLMELNCSNTSIKVLSLNLCMNIIGLNCSDNKKLISLDVSNCSKLKFLDCTGSNKLNSFDLGKCPADIEVTKPPGLVVTRKEGVKNIVIVGRTGGGKSTLSNVLTGTDEFEESGKSVSVTKTFQKKEFLEGEKNYRVVDTIGVGDTKLTTNEVLHKILDGIYSMPEGISQVLFVIDGRFKAEEASTFKLFKESVFSKDDTTKEANKFKSFFESDGGSKDNDGRNVSGKGDVSSKEGSGKNVSGKDDKGLLEYFTIVRTKFSNFKNIKECEDDKDRLRNENKTITDVINSCRDIVYVNNPPTNILVEDEEDRDTVENNKRIRARSRKILLDYLDEACQGEYFKLKTWDQLRKQIAEYLENNRDNLPEELKNNQELQTLIKISQMFDCSIM